MLLCGHAFGARPFVAAGQTEVVTVQNMGDGDRSAPRAARLGDNCGKGAVFAEAAIRGAVARLVLAERVRRTTATAFVRLKLPLKAGSIIGHHGCSGGWALLHR